MATIATTIANETTHGLETSLSNGGYGSVPPDPADIKPRILTTAINEDDTTASLQVALDTANYFGLAAKNARPIAAEVGAAVERWRNEAETVGLTKSQTDRMASAFEHEDLALALKG